MMVHSQETQCPADVLGWIPWYPDGLEEGQRGAVEAHAAGCDDCRRELALLAGDVAPAETAPDPDRLYARVLARIESEWEPGQDAERGVERDAASGEEPGATVTELPVPDRGEAVPAPAPMAPARPRSLPAASSGGLSGLALAAGLLVAVMVGALAGSWLTRGDGAVGQPTTVYLPATAGGADELAGVQGGIPLEVVFREGVPAQRINDALRALRAQIVGGPSQIGRYRLMLPADADVAAAAKMLESDGDGVAIWTGTGPVRR